MPLTPSPLRRRKARLFACLPLAYSLRNTNDLILLPSRLSTRRLSAQFPAETRNFVPTRSQPSVSQTYGLQALMLAPRKHSSPFQHVMTCRYT
eukprot:5754170-Pleurochrysis_carterae.AAC.3